MDNKNPFVPLLIASLLFAAGGLFVLGTQGIDNHMVEEVCTMTNLVTEFGHKVYICNG